MSMTHKKVTHTNASLFYVSICCKQRTSIVTAGIYSKTSSSISTVCPTTYRIKRLVPFSGITTLGLKVAASSGDIVA